MRTKAFLTVPFAVFFFQCILSHASEDALSGIPDITQEDLQVIAKHLSSLAKSGALKDVAGQVNAEESEFDIGSVQKALDMIGEMLSSPASRELLANVQRNPEWVLRELLMSQGGEEDEALQAIFMYFLSLRKVLSENAYLRNQVTALIQQNAENLLAEQSFGDALGKIAASSVFQDLKDEVEEDMQNKAGYLPLPDSGDDMSR